MRHWGASLLAFVLAACGAQKAEERVEVVDTMATEAFLQAWGDKLLCADFDAATVSCTSTQSIVQRDGDKLLVEVAEAYGPAPDAELEELIAEALTVDVMDVAAYVHVDEISYLIGGSGLGWNKDALVEASANAVGYAVTVDGQKIYPMGPPQLKAYRDAKRAYAEMVRDGITFTSYAPGSSPDQFIAETPIPGAALPHRVTWTLLPKSTDVNLRPA